MASPARWTWVWANSRSWWWTGTVCCSPWGHKESDATKWLSWTSMRMTIFVVICVFYILWNIGLQQIRNNNLSSSQVSQEALRKSLHCTVVTTYFVEILWTISNIALPWELKGLPWWLNGKESHCQCRRFRRPKFDPLEKEMTTHQYSCLGNPMDRPAWWMTVHGIVKQLDTT